MTEKRTKPKYNMWQNSAWMIGQAWKLKEKKVLLLCLLGAVFSVGGSLVNLLVAPAMLSAVERRVSVWELILTVLIFTGLLMLFSAARSYISTNTMYGRITIRSSLAVQVSLKQLTTSFPNLENDGYRDAENKAGKVTGNNSEASEAIWNTLTGLLENLAGFAIYLALIASLDPIIVLSVLATAVPCFFLSRYLNGYEYRHKDEFRKAARQLKYVGEVPYFRESAKDIRLFGLLPWIKELYARSSEVFYALHAKAQRAYLWGKLAELVLTALRNGIAYFILIRAIINGELGAAEFLLFFSAADGFSSWVNGILGGFSTLHRQSLDLSVLREYLEYPECFRFEDGEKIPTATEFELKLENVSFRYPSADDFTLKDINLTLRPGEKLAVVGLNGAGKTTLVKLMCGFYDPTEGRVLLNGKDVREFDRREYYRLFSAVFQQFHLMAASVAENVAQDTGDIDVPRVLDCLDKAGLREKICSLPNGVDTLLNREVFSDAAELSGGETQRLMLARALYRKAPFIVLDEPTAALDPIAEADLYAKYHEMTASRSAVYISHRLASTRFCDRVIFIRDGAIAEEGTHESLLARGGGYAELFEIQSRYYREEENTNE